MIHPTALIGPEVTLAEDVQISPFCVLEGKISLGKGVVLKPNVHIFGEVSIGDHTTVFSNAVIGEVPQDLSYDENTKSGVEIGSGNTIRENVTIHRGSRKGGMTQVGNENFLMAGSHLGHDSKVGNNTILANNVLLGGFAIVGDYVFLGGGTVVHQFVNVGSFGMTQGNSGLSKDLPPYCVSHGINLLAGLNVIGLRRGGFDSELRKEIKKLFTLLLNSGKNLTSALEEASPQEWSEEARLLLRAVEEPSRKGIMTR